MRSALLLLLAFSSPLSARQKPPKVYSIPLPPQANFSPLNWLVGEWSGKTSENGPAGEIHLSVSYALQQHFLVLKEEVSLATTDSAPATHESWLGVLSALPSGRGYTLRMFSSTGFITRYRVSVAEASLRFSPEGGELPPPGWLFRRTLARTGVGQLTETVEAAPPDQSFFNYYVATLTRENPPPGQAAPQASPHPAAEGKKDLPGKD
jgi:hypothetical protein